MLVFNGEIYNYRQLRAELSGAGVSFRTTSDTEVLLEAWRRWGAASLRRLRGMFAFALFDERQGALILARDPFGIKPLFWTARDGGVAFASELEGAAAAARASARDRPHGASWPPCMYYWIPEDHCVYQGVDKLPPGHRAGGRPGRPPAAGAVLRPAGRARRAVRRGESTSRICAACSRTRCARTSWPTCRSPRS